jgi:hypothetical protein
MSNTTQAPAKDPPEPSAFERMKEFTRRLIAVPKTELPSNPKRP